MNLNSVYVAGNLTRDPDLKHTPKGTAVAQLSLAINEKYKAQDGTYKESTVYVDVEVWSRTAENCAQYLKKGSSVFIEGKLKLETWEQDGAKRSKMKVRADRVQFIGSKPEGSRSQSQTPDSDGPPVLDE